MVAAKVSAVINTKPSISGRYPNGGPSVLLEAGIPIIDIDTDIDICENYKNISIDNDSNTVTFSRFSDLKNEDNKIEELQFTGKIILVQN